MYSEATSLLNSNSNSWRNLDIAPETETQLMKEILSSFDCKATDVCDNNIEVASPVHSAPNTSAPGENIVIPSNFVPVKEYAALHNITVTCAHTWVKNKKMEGHYAKKANQRLYIDKDFIPLDKRTLRKDRTKENPSCKFIPSEDNFIAVQKKMENANFVSSVIRKHIRVYKEHEYYRKHFYHEVVFDRHALIVDVNPEYFIEVLGKTNRELMQAGNAPVVVAEMDDGNWTAKNLPRYNLHHIGQEKGSPFAIIPESDHNSKKYYSIFHPGPVSENLHSPVFEQQRSKFWKDYIRYYDEYGGYNKIPFLNHKTSKKKK